MVLYKKCDTLGQVYTPIKLIEEIYSYLTPFLKEDLNVYEPGAGDLRFYHHYPYSCNYTGCEIDPPCSLPSFIKQIDFFEQELEEYDVIIGNPPFRVEAKEPSQSPIKTKINQKTIWPEIVKRCFNHLKPNGYLAMILPCIWLKKDNASIYDLFTKQKILYLKCYTCVESNYLFGYKCQTPCCYVILQKTTPDKTFQLYDETQFFSFTLEKDLCIPTKHSQLLQKSKRCFHKSLFNSCIKIPKGVPKLTVIPNPTRDYPIATTFKKGSIYGIESKEPGMYQNVPKVCLLQKEKPIPFLDKEGFYGIYGRDNYVFIEEPEKVNIFLSLPQVQKIIQSFIVRMNFYEKYVFEYLPCIEEFETWYQKMITI